MTVKFPKSSRFDGEQIQIILYGKLVDVSSWAKKHPGGVKILRIFHQRDATEQFEAFHSEKAKELALKMRKGALDAPKEVSQPSQSQVARDFVALKQKLVSLGFFKPNVLDEIFKVLLIVISLAVGIYLLRAFPDNWLMFLLGATLHAFALQQCGWVGHDYSHHSVFASPSLNDNIAKIFGSAQGLSLAWWKARHNTHHVVTNEVGNDPDIKTSPVFTFFAQSKMLNWIQKFQHIYYVPVVGLLDLYWRIESIEYLVSRGLKYFDQILLTVVQYIFLYIVWAPLGFKAFLFMSYLKGLMTGLVVFATHYAEDRLEAGTSLTFAEQNALTSRNISGGLLVDYFSGRISRQVTHHLFPMMPTSNLARADPHVRAFLNKHGIEFREDSLLGCTIRNIQALETLADGDLH